MSTPRTMYVGGACARFETTHPEFLAALDLWLRPDAIPHDDAPTDLLVRLCVGAPTQPARPPDRSQGPVHLWRDDEKVVVSDGTHAGWADLAAAAITLHAPEASVEACWSALHRCLRTLLGAVLAQRGQFGLHAGAVGMDGQAVLIFGASGAGKSTLTAHLADAGATFLADDTAYVSTSPLAVRGWPEHSRLHIDANQADGAPSLPDGKRALAPGASDTGAHTPRLLLLLGHELVTHEDGLVGAADVMAYLLQASSFGLSPAVEARRIAVLAALAAVPTRALPARPALPDLTEVSTWMQQ